MARLNIESKLWADPRFQDLMIAVGNRHAAKGMVIELWTLAQDAWFPDRKLIDPDAFRRAGLSPLLEVGLAESREGGVYALGTEDAFAWLFERQESGKKGGLASSAKRSSTSAKRSSSKSKQIQPSSSVSISSSLSVSSSPSNSISEIQKSSDGLSAVPAAAAIWEGYREAYRERYQTDPVRNAMVNSQLKQFGARVPAGEGGEIASFYVRHNDAFYVRQMHPVGLLLKDAEKLRSEWFTGSRMTSGKARDVERRQEIHDVWAPLIAKAEAEDAAR